MSYRTETVRDIAVEGVPCGWAHGQSTCQSGKPAVHVLLKGLPVAPQGAPLCAYHSPFDHFVSALTADVDQEPVLTDRQLIAAAREHFTPGMIVEGVDIRQVREVGEQMPSDDVFLVCLEGVKPGTWSDSASRLYRRSELAALFGDAA